MKIGTKYSEGKEAVKAAWDSYLVSNHGDNTTITEKSTARFLYMVCKCGEKDCAQLRASVKEGIWTINKVQPRKAMCCSKRERNVASKVIRQSNPVIFNKVLVWYYHLQIPTKNINSQNLRGFDLSKRDIYLL